MTNPITDDQRLARAVELKLANPKWSIARISKEAGGLCKERCRNYLVEAGALEPRFADDHIAAPDWYSKPSGRIVAQRQGEGIDP